MPIFPAIAAISGTNAISISLSLDINRPTILAPIIPPKRPMINQGILALIKVNKLSFDSMFSNIPDAICIPFLPLL